MPTTKLNINGINELDFPTGVSSVSVSQGIATVNLNSGGFNGVNLQTGISYTFLQGDIQKLVSFSNASAIAATLPQAGSGGNFLSGWVAWVENTGSGVLTITPSTSTIDGLSSIVLNQNQGCVIFSNGTNYFTERGISAGGGGSFARSTSIITTAVLAVNASELSAKVIGKTIEVIQIQSNDNTRVRFYSTAAQRNADASRPIGTPPTAGTSHGVIGEWVLNSGTGLIFICSPAAIGSNADSPATTNIYYNIENMGLVSQAMTITLTLLVEE